MNTEMVGRGCQISLIEDDPRIRQLIEAEIADEGHHVRSFSSAEDFLEAAGTLPSDLVLLDLMLPGMDGLTCLAELQKIPSDKPHRVVVVTALNDAATRQQAIRLGAVDYILKPDLFERLPLLLEELQIDHSES